jgi:hypothetical protein
VTEAKWQVSQAGGTFPRWRRDSKELLYYGVDGRLYAVNVGGTTALTVSAPVPLFAARMLNGPNNAVGLKHQYDISPDGRRLLLNVTLDDTSEPPITVVLNALSVNQR